jgi:uncharacterized protein (TIGR02001 family)
MHNQTAIFSNHGVHMTFKFKVAAAAVAFLAAGAVQAQKAPEPDFTIAYNVGAVSQYRFRGIEQTSGTPSLQAGIDFAHKNGFYAGFATSRVTWVKEYNGASNGEREMDYFLGFKTSVSDFNLDFGAIQYQYPGNDSGGSSTPGGIAAPGAFVDANTTEVYVGVGYGIASFKVSHATSNFLGFANSAGAKYYDLSLNFDLGNGLTVVPHVGSQTIPNQALGTDSTVANYTDYALTLNKDFGNGWSASLAAVGTNAKAAGWTAIYNGQTNRFLGSNTGVVGVKYTF